MLTLPLIGGVTATLGVACDGSTSIVVVGPGESITLGAVTVSIFDGNDSKGRGLNS